MFSDASTVAEFTMVGWINKTRRMGVGHPHILIRPGTHGRGKPVPTTDPGHHRQRAARRRYRADTEQRQAGDTGSDVPVESPDGRPLAHLFLFQLTNLPQIQAPRDSDSFCQLLDYPQKIAQTELRYALRKKYGIIWEFFPTWGGGLFCMPNSF